jgi:hypothetical protein
MSDSIVVDNQAQQIIVPKTAAAFNTGNIRGDTLLQFMEKVAGNLLTGVYTYAFLVANFPPAQNAGKRQFILGGGIFLG